MHGIDAGGLVGQTFTFDTAVLKGQHTVLACWVDGQLRLIVEDGRGAVRYASIALDATRPLPFASPTSARRPRSTPPAPGWSDPCRG